jgi:hypothetical protein
LKYVRAKIKGTVREVSPGSVVAARAVAEMGAVGSEAEARVAAAANASERATELVLFKAD